MRHLPIVNARLFFTSPNFLRRARALQKLVMSKGMPKPVPRPRHSSVVFDVDETCPGGRVGGDDDPKLMVKPHTRDARFIDRPGPPVLGKGQ